MYQALYRKWRPQTFDEVVGQKHITETLKNQVKTGRLSHAYLFIGTRGTGKTTCARILAKAVNCLNPVDGNPCGVCEACRGISDGSVLDVVELDAASNNGVDNVRALREEAVFSPASVKKRVYIIDEVHMLSTSAFNALLKILEEPPEHLMFILATTELQKVPATILSRCQRHSFRRIDAPEIAEYLEYIAKQEDFSLSHDAAELIARLADGGVRDALSLLDQCSAAKNIDVDAVYSAMGLAGNRRTAELLEHILSHSTEPALELFNSLWMAGKDPVTLLGELSSLLRDSLMLQVAPKGGQSLVSGSFDGETLKSFAGHMTAEEIICAMETLQRCMNNMRDAKNPKTAAELCLVSLCDNSLGESLSALRARVSRVERMLEEGAAVSAVRQPQRWDEDELGKQSASYENETEPECGDIDPEYFAEEQPEDSFVQRQDKAPEPGKNEPAEQRGSDMTADCWPKVLEKAMDTLPMDVRHFIGDGTSVRGHMENDVLHIEAVPGFLYGRVNRQEVLTKLSAAASELTGRETRTVLSELKEAPRQQRSLDELKQFKEVRFL